MKLWVSVESIEDANLVDFTAVPYPVIIARMTQRRGSSREATDKVYGVKGGAQYYLIVSPDRFDGTEDQRARWDIVSYKPRGSSFEVEVVTAGTGFQPCVDSTGAYHPQKDAPFAWFVNCDLASALSFEQLMVAKSPGLDSARRESLVASARDDLKASLRMAVENSDLIWITCGLGCCSTGTPGT